MPAKAYRQRNRLRRLAALLNDQRHRLACPRGAELMIEVALFWASVVDHDPVTGRYMIRGVIGPDEYHNGYPGSPQPGLNNNAV